MVRTVRSKPRCHYCAPTATSQSTRRQSAQRSKKLARPALQERTQPIHFSASLALLDMSATVRRTRQRRYQYQSTTARFVRLDTTAPLAARRQLRAHQADTTTGLVERPSQHASSVRQDSTIQITQAQRAFGVESRLLLPQVPLAAIVLDNTVASSSLMDRAAAFPATSSTQTASSCPRTTARLPVSPLCSIDANRVSIVHKTALACLSRTHRSATTALVHEELSTLKSVCASAMLFRHRSRFAIKHASTPHHRLQSTHRARWFTTIRLRIPTCRFRCQTRAASSEAQAAVEQKPTAT